MGPQDVNDALEWYQKPADQGNAFAWARLKTFQYKPQKAKAKN